MPSQNQTDPRTAMVPDSTASTERSPWRAPGFRILQVSLSESGLNITTDGVEGTS
jgi:hypothetical protein